MDASHSPPVYFEGQWSTSERTLIETAAEEAENAGLPAPPDVLGAPWVATQQVVGNLRLYMASRQQGKSALMDQSAEGLADRIRRFGRRNGDASPPADTRSASPPLFQLVYTSTATRAMTDADLQELLAQARSNNEELDITGLLLYANGQFLQVLEGPEPAVRRLFDTIRNDPRHTSVETLLTTDTTERTFPDWKMGLDRPVPVSDEGTFSSFLKTGDLPPAADPLSEVLEVLERFRQNAPPASSS